MARDQGTASPATRTKRCTPSRKLNLEHPKPVGSEQEEQPALWGPDGEENGVGDINDQHKPEPSVAVENGAAAAGNEAAEDTHEVAAVVKHQPSELAGPEAEVGDPRPDTNVEQHAKPKEEPQAEKDRAAAAKDDEEASTAPLPEKVSCIPHICAVTCIFLIRK